MGYNSWVSGELVAKPGIPQHVLDKAGLGDEDTGSVLDLVGTYDGNETVGVLPDGTIGVIGDSLSRFEIRYNDEYRSDDLVDHVVLLAELCKARGCLLNGDLRVTGEENADIWRVVVKDNRVEELQPTLVWPDGLVE